jgi:hypothetical protein
MERTIEHHIFLIKDVLLSLSITLLHNKVHVAAHTINNPSMPKYDKKKKLQVMEYRLRWMRSYPQITLSFMFKKNAEHHIQTTTSLNI